MRRSTAWCGTGPSGLADVRKCRASSASYRMAFGPRRICRESPSSSTKCAALAHALCSLHRAAYDMQHETTCSRQHTSCNIQAATYFWGITSASATRAHIDRACSRTHLRLPRTAQPQQHSRAHSAQMRWAIAGAAGGRDGSSGPQRRARHIPAPTVRAMPPAASCLDSLQI